MKGLKKCYGILLVLFIMVLLSLSVCSGNTNALKYEYDSVPYFSFAVPFRTEGLMIDSETGNYVLDPDYSPSNFDNYFTYFPGITLAFYGDAFYSDLSSISFSHPLSYFTPAFDSEISKCNYLSSQSGGGVHGLVPGSRTSSSLDFSNSGNYFILPDNYTSSNLINGFCHYLHPFGQSPQPSFNPDSVPLVQMIDSNSLSLGTSGPGAQVNARAYIETYMRDYPFTSNGFYTHSHAIDTNGVHYNHSFSFSDMFNQSIKKFSELSIPLYSFDDFWTDGNNFTADRPLEFSGSFEFDSQVSFHPNIDTNGSSFKVRVYTLNRTLASGLGNRDYFDIPCDFNYVTVPDANNYIHLDWICSGSMPYQSPYAFPVLMLEGANPYTSNDTYIFETDGDWRFAGVFITTDNDDTPGGHLGTHLVGSYILGDASNDFSEDDQDWFSSLVNLFNFGLINPFAPIFELFDNESVCANIPTIAGMLHSEESQVCPFFDSSVRAITTPVLGISSIMLLFGFVVRWLGASSGNMFEDSGHIAPPADLPAGSAGVRHVGWRRK